MNTRTPQVGDVYTSKSGIGTVTVEKVIGSKVRIKSTYVHDPIVYFDEYEMKEFLELAEKSIRNGATLTQAARTTDPDTSREAAEIVKNLRQKQADVLRVLRYFEEGATHEQVIREYRRFSDLYGSACRQSESGLRTRLCELVRMGLVEDSGRREKTASGRRAIVWRVKK